ncbi:hypothetical protein CONLIGDRAFT_139140 [Coniochaeta ligniaria NRRL 30616]|uniref:Uncharacterized protein n=1 Tax=Coniochaeta ligniaria NRRL 30616 TaxID=1408157 RepID=A0A1J7I850_9PEZI|nr:hypothetical protein CONLIGDRAFT_139140 [Coniochaeta ligniaria NRRL 30616]
MKSAVFDDGLLHMVALSAVGTLRHGTLGHIPLLLQSTVLLAIPAAIRACISPGRPRPSAFDLGATCHEVTGDISKPAPTNAFRHDATKQRDSRPVVEDAILRQKVPCHFHSHHNPPHSFHYRCRRSVREAHGITTSYFASVRIQRLFTFTWLVSLIFGKHSVGLGIASAYRGMGALVLHLQFSSSGTSGRPVSLSSFDYGPGPDFFLHLSLAPHGVGNKHVFGYWEDTRRSAAIEMACKTAGSERRDQHLGHIWIFAFCSISFCSLLTLLRLFFCFHPSIACKFCIIT